ncbi:MAG: hypothetical protein E7399_01260 [Ruminococcaceae bacterium]|nr:hypothetical protein [Oscillospiraceae bacterium]
MKAYVKPSLAVTRFTSQETIANAYDTPTVGTESVTIDGAQVSVPVTTYNITSLGETSAMNPLLEQ